VENLHYYEGVGIDELDFDGLLIIKTELVAYGETKNAKWIQRQTLKDNSNRARSHFKKGSTFGGSFDRAIKKLSEQGLIRFDKRGRKDMRIWFDYELIKRDLDERKRRNIENDSLSIIRSRHNILDHFNKSRPLSESLSTSDSVSKMVTKAQRQEYKLKDG
jgi:hypothetical protein